MQRTLLAAGWFAATAAALSAQAAVPPPAWPAKDGQAVSARAEPVRQVIVGPLQVDLGHTTFDEVQNALGFSPIQQHGDAAHGEKWVCYTIPRLSARVWLRSSELGGHEAIDGLTARLVGLDSTATEECPNIIMRDNRVITDTDVALGSPVRDIGRHLNAASTPPQPVVSYSFEGKSGGMDVVSTLTLKVSGGKVIELHAMRSSTP